MPTDTERLDWVRYNNATITRGNYIGHHYSNHWIVTTPNTTTRNVNLREAIDAAMRAEGEGGE